ILYCFSFSKYISFDSIAKSVRTNCRYSSISHPSISNLISSSNSVYDLSENMQYSLGENRITLKQDKLFGKMFVVRHISDDEVEVKSLANLKSAIKRVRTNETKRELNQTPRTQART